MLHSKFSKSTRYIWWIIGIGLTLTIAWSIAQLLTVLVLAIFLYYATRPLYRHIHSRTQNPSISAGVSLLVFGIPIIFVGLYSFSVAIDQAYSVSGPLGNTQIQQLLNSSGLSNTKLVSVFSEVQSPSSDSIPIVLQYIPKIAVTVVDSINYLSVLILQLVLLVSIAFFLLRDDTLLSTWVTDTIGQQLPFIIEFLEEVDVDLSEIFFGNILYSILTGIISIPVLSLLLYISPSEISIPVFLIGVLIGITSIIPVVGSKLVYVPYGGYITTQLYVQSAIRESVWFVLLFILLLYVLADTIPDVFLRPYVSSKRINLGVLLITYITGPLLFGWTGIFLAPIILVCTIHYYSIVLPELLKTPTA